MSETNEQWSDDTCQLLQQFLDGSNNTDLCTTAVASSREALPRSGRGSAALHAVSPPPAVLEPKASLAPRVNTCGTIAPKACPFDAQKIVAAQENDSKLPCLRKDAAAISAEIAKIPSTKEVFDAAANLINPVILEKFRRDIHINSPLFSDLTPTTFGLNGCFKGVHFSEQYFISEIEPTEEFPFAQCNYGQKIHPSYTLPAPKKSTGRGRKKKPRQMKSRTVQGKDGYAGTCFNSSILFGVKSQHFPGLVYKFKVFRTGQFGVPGIKPGVIDDTIECISRLGAYLFAQLNNAASKSVESISRPPQNDAHTLEVLFITPVMKNYKFRRLLPKFGVLHLQTLSALLIADKERQTAIDETNRAQTPKIYYIKPNGDDGKAKVSVKFSTPIFGKAKKTTLINIFMGGRINILGAYDIDATQRICDYLCEVLTNPICCAKIGEVPQGIGDTFRDWLRENPTTVGELYRFLF
ncbi:MAG: hypothetical protein M0R33_13725 [Methylomonas sp.]|jgi:hypothetical protein|uniref:hypothetical protein n=1 Tax=Methylomonas sp. TaxID=418 RepID=UPI0025DA1F8F|nr:hypothetical protein [Methylomonas sp.]MCK9607494.1 hypothetical protein [Methylomonas sp.]